jgi:alkanesulfonate monooxygenase SsuD/methylene tetrahydromethanopterin reductase-like flavin-dependent oxidoreductase (luciferase family)
MAVPTNVMDKLGVYVFPWGAEPPSIQDLVTSAQHAERLGFGSLQIAWHFTGDPKYGNTFSLDPLVVTPILAAETERIKISINSIILPILHPYFWARYFANLDLASGGRIIPGLALGWAADDFRIGLSNVKQRGKRFDEALEIFHRLIKGESISEPGTYWDATGLELAPAARADMQVWIGAGEISIERTAQWGNALNPTHSTIEEITNVLRPRLDEAGTRYGKRLGLIVTQTAAVVLPGDSDDWQQQWVWGPLEGRPRDRDCDGTIVGDPAECARRLAAQFEAGADEVLLEVDFHGAIPAGEHARDQMTRIAQEVVPLIQT